MRRGILQRAMCVAAVVSVLAGGALAVEKSEVHVPATAVDRILNAENEGRTFQAAGFADDLMYLRRVSVDLAGRIPSESEIQAYLKLSPSTRRAETVERLLADPRFADRWTVFFADMLRVRSNADGGPQLIAFVHKAVEDGMPYDVMCRQLISANGRAGKTPEIGFILGDNADPMALAGVTSQVFMGIRISCAQCHDHPHDVWTRKQFYGFAAYFGKTRRVESELTRAVYTVETDQTAVLWPPADPGFEGKRSPVDPEFPFQLVSATEPADYIARLQKLREAPKEKEPTGPSLDDLLADAGQKAKSRADGLVPEGFDVASEAKRDAKNLNVKDDLYRASQQRRELADLVTSPRNRYFSECLTNRVWAELVGRGFVEPIDDFSQENAASHPRTLAYLADEFVAGGYDLRKLVRTIVLSQPYQRDRLLDVDEPTRQAAQEAFVSAPLRRMISESLYDSIVQAGHLFDVKYPPGANPRTVKTLVRIPIETEKTGKLASLKTPGKSGGAMPAMKPQMIVQSSGYDLESSIEVNFDELLMAKDDAPEVEKMAIVSKEELEAMQMTPGAGPRQRYIERFVDQVIDDNPSFASAMRMVSPADPSHFLRVFGQPSRQDLGEHRDDSASMRQALMMLNGRLTHEAARVGDFEPMHKLLVGEKVDLDAAIRLAYREILTREPKADELVEAKSIIAGAPEPREGMADLRWVLLNCHEFRFLR